MKTEFKRIEKYYDDFGHEVVVYEVYSAFGDYLGDVTTVDHGMGTIQYFASNAACLEAECDFWGNAVKALYATAEHDDGEPRYAYS